MGRSKSCLTFVPALVTVAITTLLTNIADAETPLKWHRATVEPSLVHLEPGETHRFKVVMIATRMMAAGAPSEVRWAVNNIPGGNSVVGAIDEGITTMRFTAVDTNGKVGRLGIDQLIMTRK